MNDDSQAPGATAATATSPTRIEAVDPRTESAAAGTAPRRKRRAPNGSAASKARAAGKVVDTVADAPVDETAGTPLPTIVPAEPVADVPAPPPPASTPTTPAVVGDQSPVVAAAESRTAVLPVVTTDVDPVVDGTDGLPSMRAEKRPQRPLRRPVKVSRARPRVRRVTRVVRHVDAWSVFKVALVFNLFLYAVCLTAGVLLWRVAVNTGTVDNVERFFESFGWSSFQLKAGQIYHNAWVAGLFVVVGFTGLAVLAATLFNLITDLVGGIRVSVLEEEVIAREDRGLVWRRGRVKPIPRTASHTSGDDDGQFTGGSEGV